MTGHVGERAYDYLMEALPPEEQSALTAHLASCTFCSRELRATAEALGTVALALDPVPPPPGGRERLLAATRTGRFADFAERVARFFDVARERAGELLDWIDEPGRWERQLDWIHLVHLEGGPAVAGADAGFVRLRAGTRFPAHRHLGEERVLVLQGTLHLDDGRVLRRGDGVVSLTGTAHSFYVGDEVDCIYAVVHKGIEILPPPSAS
ncbi:MAG TPA: cupin domain-containing protein [Polyangia bacterium]|jgi:anti-sigma factor ChrR (cupin superfamily)|nr:cupin domain-containing protein [Polyangia bacterium]